MRIASLPSIPRSAQPFVDQPVPSARRASYVTSLLAYQCLSCSHVQADCPRVPYYKDVITTSSLSPSILQARDSNIQRICQLLQNPNPSIFEVGASKGHYLDHLRSIGYNHVEGLENSCISPAQPANSCFRLQQGYLLDEDLDLHRENCYDIILCFNFIEHIPSPFQFLQVIKSRLAAPSSYFYFTMPNYEYIKSQNLLQEFVPDHISYFTTQSLKVLLQRNNLDIISLNEINNANDLEVIAHHHELSITPLDPTCFTHLINSLNSILINASQSNLSVAFWGAGHRSLTLILQLQFELISFIVDSAEFKQGKYCPDTGLLIVGPLNYCRSPSDILILSLPGVYAMEVIDQLEQLGINTAKIYNIQGNELLEIK